MFYWIELLKIKFKILKLEKQHERKRQIELSNSIKKTY